MQILALGVESRSWQRHPILPAIQAANAKPAQRMRAQPVTVTGGPDQPFFVRGHQLPVNRADLAPLVYENERTIEAMPAPCTSIFPK